MTSDTKNQQNDKPISNPLIEQLRHNIHTSTTLAHRFHALIEAIVNAGDSKVEFTCHEVQSVLDVYISDELKGRDVRAEHLEIWQHILTCASCRREYEVLAAALSVDDVEAVPDFTPALRPLSFLQPRGDPARWNSRIRSRLMGASFGFHILLNPDFLKSKFASGLPRQSAETYRSDAFQAPAESSPLVVDNVSFDGQRLNVEIDVARSGERPDRITLLADLTGDAPLPDNLWVRLAWSGQTYRAPVTCAQPDEGHAVIEDIPLDRVCDASDIGEARFEIVLEARDELADDDGISFAE